MIIRTHRYPARYFRREPCCYTFVFAGITAGHDLGAGGRTMAHDTFGVIDIATATALAEVSARYSAGPLSASAVKHPEYDYRRYSLQYSPL